MTIRFYYNRLYTSQDTSSSPFIQGTRLWCSKYRIDSYIRSISNKGSSGHILLSNQLFYSTRYYSSSNYTLLNYHSVGRSGMGKTFLSGEVELRKNSSDSIYFGETPLKMYFPENYGGVYGFASPYRYGKNSSGDINIYADMNLGYWTYISYNNNTSVKIVNMYKVSYNE